MNTSSKILFWNGRAIASLKDGEFVSSVTILKKALDELKDSLDDAEMQGPAHDEGQNDSLPSVRSISIIEEGASIESDSNQLFDLYPRAFELPNGTSKPRAVVALLYNLALTFDIRALTTEDAHSTHINQSRAIDLYSTALKVASTSWNQDDMLAMASVTVAIVNNLGRLQSLRLAFADTKHLLKLSMDLLNSPNALTHMNDADRVALSTSIAPFICLGDHVLTNAPMA